MQHDNAVRWGLMAVLAIGAITGQANAQQSAVRGGNGTNDVQERLSGAPFRYVGGEQQRAAVHDAIDHAVAPMNFIERPIARRRLTDRNVVEDSVGFRFQPGAVNVQIGANSTLTRDDFSPTPSRAVTGERMQVRQRIEGNRLVQSLTTSEGERRDEFFVSPDGRRLTMRVTVRSPKLRQPMQYQLNYAR